MQYNIDNLQTNYLACYNVGKFALCTCYIINLCQLLAIAYLNLVHL